MSKTKLFQLVLVGCVGPLVLIVGCQEEVKVEVNCQMKEAGAECEAKQTMGKGEAKTCWDFTVECADNVKIEAPNTCATLKDGGSEKVTIPKDKLKNLDKCTKAEKATVTNMTINGEKPH